MGRIELNPELAHDSSLFTKLMHASVIDPPLLKLENPESFYPIFDLQNDERMHWLALKETCKSYMGTEELSRLDSAVALMKYAHQTQERDAGERYSNHCFRVGRILAEQRLEANTLIAGILHDVLEDSEKNGVPVTSEFIARVFGSDVEKLVLGCRNSEWDVILKPEDISGYNHMTSDQLTAALKEEYDRRTVLKNFRQFSGEPQNDPRVILIKLADRIDNMRTIFGKDSKLKQQQKAVEALEVSANLAKIIGDEEKRRELSDLAMEVVDGRMFYYLTDVVFRSTGITNKVDPKDYNRHNEIIRAVETIHPSEELKVEIADLVPNDLGINPDRISISFPGIYAMHQTWKEKEDKSVRFGASDIYAKVRIPIPSEELRYDSNISSYENRIKSEFKAKGWRILTGYKSIEEKQASENERVFFCQNASERTIKVKLISDDEDNGNRFRLSGFYDGSRVTPSMVNQLTKLAGDYQIIARGDAESRQKVRTFIREMGGIRVQGIKPGEFTLLRKGATILEYAYKVRGEMLGRLTGFQINGGEMHYVKDMGMVLQNDWRVTLHFNESIQSHMNVTPEWLRDQTDPDVLAVLAEVLEKRLRYFQSQGGISTYEPENRAIVDIGVTKLDRMLIYQGHYVGAGVALDYIRMLGFENTGEFLRAVAVGQVGYFDLLIIAEEMDKFTRDTIAIDIDYPSDHPISQRFITMYDKLKAISELNLIRREEREVLGERIFVRYYFPINQIAELYGLVSRMGEVYFHHDDVYLPEKSALVIDHIPSESIYYAELKKLSEEFTERKSMFARDDVVRTIGEGSQPHLHEHKRKKLNKYERRKLWEKRSKAKVKKLSRHGPQRR